MIKRLPLFLACCVAFAQGQKPQSWTSTDVTTLQRSGYNSLVALGGKVYFWSKANNNTIYSNTLASFVSGSGMAVVGSSGSTIETCPDGQGWKANFAYVYSTGNDGFIIDSAGHLQRLITGGTSGATQPAWNHAGGTTTDGTAVWRDQGIWPPDRHPGQTWWSDSNRKRVYAMAGVCGGIDPDKGAPFNLWYYVPGESQWHAVNTSHNPAGMIGEHWLRGAGHFNPDDNIELQFGGDSGGQPHTFVYCPTDLNPVRGSLTAVQTAAGCVADDWAQVTTTGGPPTARAYMSVRYVGGGRWILFGGSNGSNAMYNQTWMYSASTKTYTQLNSGASNSPPVIAWGAGGGVIHQYATEYVSSNGLLYVWDYVNGHLWTLDPINGNGKWRDQGSTAIDGSTGPVCQTGGAQCGDSMAYDPISNKLVLEALTNSTNNNMTVWTAQLQPIVNGLGGTTTTNSGSCLDKDGDGYGVGPTCTGPDADDNDAAVHTGAQIVSKWGTLKAAINHLGYYPTNFWYLATTGSDAATCHDTDGIANIGAPCATFAHIAPSVAAGDMVIFRGGAYAQSVAIVQGSAGSPVVYMSYPGELATFSGVGNAFQIKDKSWFVMDGFRLTGTGSNGCMDGGTSDTSTDPVASTFHNIVFRHIDASGCEWGLSAFNWLVDITVEENVFHDNSGSGAQHGLYFGSRKNPSTDVTIRRNLFYGNDYCGVQWNGRVTYLYMDGNISYSNLNDGYCWENGVSNSFFRNNVAFNNGHTGLAITNYDGSEGVANCGVNRDQVCTCNPANVAAICAYNQTENLIQNFTTYNTGLDRNGAGPDSDGTAHSLGAIMVGYQTACTTGVCKSTDLGKNIFRNVIAVNYGGDSGGRYAPIRYPDDTKTFLASSVWDHVVGWQNTGAGTTVFGYGLSPSVGYNGYDCSGAAGLTTLSACTFGDPKFASASTTFYNTPASFNLRLQGASPALHAGAPEESTAFDIAGGAFASVPSIGAFDQSGVTGTPPAVTTRLLASAPKGLAYSQTLAASGDAPITWSITAGSLPAGLSLNSSTGAITGSAIGATGTTTFTLQASNASGTTSKSLSIVVRNPNVPADYATVQAGLTGIAGLGCGNTLTIDVNTYTETLTVPASSCTLSNPITVEGNGPIPTAGIRSTPNYLDPTPKIPVIQGAAPGTVMKFTYGDTQSNGWVFKGIAINCSLNVGSGICVEVGTQDWTAFYPTMASPQSATGANLPSHITFDHCILRGSRLGMARVGLQLNGQDLNVSDSWLGDLWDFSATDGQAIRAMSGDGPITVTNTYMDGQTETFGVGGPGSIITTPSLWYGPYNNFMTGGSIPGGINIDESHLTHGLWLRYDGMNPYKWSHGQLTRMGQVWRLCSSAADGVYGCTGSDGVGTYQAQNVGISGATMPTACTTNNCTFTDGTITWKAISNFTAGETYIGSGIAKNLAECKECGSWTIRRSFLEHAWEGGGGGGAQGYALTFTHRMEAAYTTLGPITVSDNIINDAAGVLNASAFGDDVDSNIYPTVRSSLAGPFTITTGVNDTLVVDGTTVTLTPGSRTVAQIADDINLALPHLTVSSVSAPNDSAPYWTRYVLTLSGNVQYGMDFDMPTILSAIRNGITRTDLGGQNIDNQSVPIHCTYDSIHNGGAGRSVCSTAGPNQVELQFSYGARIAVDPAATIATPTVASSYHDYSDGNDYLLIVKGQYVTILTISGNAAATLGLPSSSTYYCTHPITREWYGCGRSKGLTFTNNLVTNVSNDENKFAASRSPYLMWPGGIHPLEISHNTFDYKYGAAFLGQGAPNSGAIRNNIMLNRNAAPSGETSYFNDGRQAGLSWIQSYLCNPALDGTNIGSYSWMANGSALPTCQPGVAGNNILPGATVDGNETISGAVPGTTNVPHSSYAPTSSGAVVFKPGTWQLAPPGTVAALGGTYNIFGNQGNTTGNSASVELGTKFFADLDGQITKIRLFRSVGCPVEDVFATLWGPTGTLLATVTVAGVPQNTWGEAALPSPVAIAAGTNYTVSYHSTSCYTTNIGSASSQIDAFVLHVPVGGFVFGAVGAFPTNTSTNGFGVDVVYQTTQAIAVGQYGTIGSAQGKSAGDPADTGVDTKKLPLINNLSVTYSDRAVIVSWQDSEASQSIPGVLRLCTDDPDYNPTCTPRGSIASSDPVTGSLADNSDNDSSPKNGLQRYIIVTGLAANTKYYAQLYRGGHYRAFSFRTAPGMTGSTSVSISRAATTSMGSVATMLTSYGATYRRSSGTVTGSTASVACATGSNCFGAVTASLGDPVYLQSQMQNSAGAVLYAYPVSVTIPGGATLFP